LSQKAKICQLLINMVYFLHMKAHLSQIQVQKQILAPTMQQSIEVLLLPIMELNQAIQQELEINPLLELQEEDPEETDPAEELLRKEELLQKELDIPYRHDDQHSLDPVDEKPLQYAESLEEGLLHQLRIEFEDPLKLGIGTFIIGNLNEDGYLKIPCSEIAAEFNLADEKPVEEVLRVIHRFEPPGIAARDLKECLLIQIEALNEPHKELLNRLVTTCLPELGQKRHVAIGRKLRLSLPEVKKAVRLIADLDPRPARNYRIIQPYIYIKPDIIITADRQQEFQVLINDRDVPPLRINPIYRAMLRSAPLNHDEKDFIRDKMKNALYFIRSVRQRGQTLKDIAQVIVKRQHAFLLNGHTGLVPMSLKDIAKELDRNESTISRAIQNKYIDTPQGIFPLKFFFSQGLGQNDQTAEQGISNRRIKEEIKRLIDEEDKSTPMNDQALQESLRQEGIQIARRTIAKYRQLLHILPAHLRKE